MDRRLFFLLIGWFWVVGLMPVNAQDVAPDLLGRINALRDQNGLAPYSLNAALTAAAQNHATWMAQNSAVSHVQSDGSSPADRARAAGYSSNWVSENIYMGGRATVNDAWRFWLNSSIHYAGLVNRNYQHIGIASARGAGGQAFVLVFGAPGGNVQQLNANTGNNGGNQAAPAGPPPPPPGVIGRDAVGNIRYELQAGDTLGNVLLLFGYTWDDLPQLMALNELSDADIRSLDIGQELLVMPYDGTYTPTPAIEATATPTLTVTPDATLPTLAPPITEIVASPTQPVSTMQAPQISYPATMTPTPTATRPVTQVAMAVTSPPMVADSAPPPPTGDLRSLLLMVVIGVQVGILTFAALEFWRRMRSN